MLSANERHRSELERGDVAIVTLPYRRTMYAVQLSGGQWAGPNAKWTDSPEHATRYHSMTAATIAATFELGLEPLAYTVEAV